jgi:formyl-CoA transferase
MKTGVGIADVMCGMYATVGILAALRYRDATGEGQHIDLSLVDCQMAWLVNEGVNYLTSGAEPVRRGNAHPNIVPYDAFACSDGHVLIAVGNDAQFSRFCDSIALPHVAADPKFATNLGRIENRTELMSHLNPALGQLSKGDILARLHAVKVPAGPINTVAQALNTDQAVARGAVIEIPTSIAADGKVRLLGNPLKLSKTPVQYRRAPPTFGQDSKAILETFLKEADTG